MNIKKKRRIIVLAPLAALFVLLIASVEITSTSKFCSTCHYMKPFYQSWKESAHSKIECSICHYPPGLKSKLRAKIEGLMQLGRYWTKLYLKSKPWAEIPDESCLRPGCHEKRLLEGQVKFKKIVFDHKIHFADLRRGKRLRCTSCHSQIVQGQHITVTESTCFICHFKESKFYPKINDCSHCHHKQELISEKISRHNHTLVFDNGFKCDKCHSHTIIGDGAVPRENCYKCHFEKERLDKYGDTDLIHSMHISTHKIECNQCHLEIQHKIVKDIETIADCKSCHTGFHRAQKILYTGEGGKGVQTPMPNTMLEKGLSCEGCHIFHEEAGGRLIKSQTHISRAQACESCHGKGFTRILKDWEISTGKKLQQIKAMFQKASQEISQTEHAQKNRAQALLEDAAFNIDVVEKGKSVHNMAYSQELLSASYSKLQEALQLINSSSKLESFVASAKEVPTQCSYCHTGIEEITVPIFGLNFPHKSHLFEQKIQCSTCHSNIQKHGELTASKQSCAGCHHQDPKKDCGICHLLQKTFFQGGSSAEVEIPKDKMFEAGVDCSGCHVNAEKQIIRPDGKKCVDCHENKYADTFTEWQNSIKALIHEIKAAFKEKEKTRLFDQEKTQLLKAHQALEKIELDGSFGVHNYPFLEEALTNLKNTVNSLGKKS
jgi:nitrate/TMAO reductase-like tetraheme cytochrome c subunit